MRDVSAEWSDVLDDTPERLEANEADRLGRYVLCRRLADGGMGTVYLAKAEGPGGFERAFAIKRIHPHLARRKDLVEMFLDEARLSARIHHPNVCSTIDFGEADGAWFLAMEYLLGESLASVVRAVATAPGMLASARWRALAARVIAEAAEGLHAAHELTDERGSPLGVVHRDVSPQNLFVTYDGAVKVLDFGVARAEGRIHQTRAGALKGKVSYMAPEQVSGRPVDRRADVFALGVCLWEALTGRRLFRRETDVETIQQVGSLEVPAPSSIVPGIEPALDACVLRALARDLDARTPSARALAAELEAYLHGRATATTRADLAALMSERFAARRAGKQEIVRTELAGTSDERSGIVPVPAVPIGGARLGEVTPSFAPPPPARIGRAGEATPSFAPPRPGEQTPTVTAPPEPAEVRAPSPAPRRWRPVVALGSAVALVVALGAAFALATPARERAAVVLPPAADAPSREASASVAGTDPSPAIDVAPPRAADVAPAAEEPASTEPASSRVARRRRADPPPEREPASEAAPGRVNVVTRGGWADVYLGGRLLGRTPRSVELPAGEHVLTLRPFGRAPGRDVRVRVEPGGVERVVEEVSE
ncbi:MAG: protein kinase [Sandaracinaceae bacterium]|nr:protein kinase [Sandaracinaceae bacterium]